MTLAWSPAPYFTRYPAFGPASAPVRNPFPTTSDFVGHRKRRHRERGAILDDAGREASAHTFNGCVRAVAACPPPWLFLGTASRSVEVDVFTGITTSSTRPAAVNFPGLVVDVRTFACLGWDVATVSRFAIAYFIRIVTFLKVPLSRMVCTIVFIA